MFFHIFYNIYFSEAGLGEFDDIDFAQGVKVSDGVALRHRIVDGRFQNKKYSILRTLILLMLQIFVQKAIGGCAIGLAGGAGIIFVLSMLHRRHGKEENIVQVTAVLGLVYLNYYVAEVVLHTSGVIATLAAGLSIKFFGRAAINNIHLMDDFFSITEHILNTILFSLGGLVWGRTIVENHEKEYWTASHWGYLILLYVLLHVIRAVLFVSAYPITSRIGLKSNWKETTFQIYGGLRGAVGIALAIALDNELDGYADDESLDEERRHVGQVYGMVGGIAFLTLFINGATAGPFLKWLGLADSTDARHKIIEAYRAHLRAELTDILVKLLTEKKFKSVDFSFVQRHIEYLSDLTLDQLVEAVEKLKQSTPTSEYAPPYLQNLLSVLEDDEGLLHEDERYAILWESPEMYARNRRMEKRKRGRMSTGRLSMIFTHTEGDSLSLTKLRLKELRLLFISMLKAQYENLVDEGLLSSQHGLTIALEQSLEMARTDVNEGGDLNDLQHLQQFHNVALKCVKFAEKSSFWLIGGDVKKSVEEINGRGRIMEAFAFISAHEGAQAFFQEHLGDADSDLSEPGRTVLGESKKQVEKIEKDLNSNELKAIATEVSTHKLCDILLTRGIMYVENLVEFGLLKESEAEEMIEDMTHIQKAVSRAKCVNMNSVPETIEEGNEKLAALEEEPKESAANDEVS